MSTVNDIIADAYREIGVVGYEDAMDGAQAQMGLRYLYRMLRAWQVTDHLWLSDDLTVNLTTAASYSLTSVRPVRVHGARFVSSGVETPMCRMTRQEYLDLPVKTSTGRPTAFYFDAQRTSPVLYIWPVPASDDGTTIILDIEREITEPLLRAGTLDVPAEWHDAVMFGLADRLSVPFERNVPGLAERAMGALSDVLAADREGSVFFAGPYA